MTYNALKRESIHNELTALGRAKGFSGAQWVLSCGKRGWKKDLGQGSGEKGVRGLIVNRSSGGVLPFLLQRWLNMLAVWHPSYWERPCPPSLKTWTLTPTVCLWACVLELHHSISQPWFLFGCFPWLWFVETPSWWNHLSVYQEHSCSLPSCFRMLVPPMGPWTSSTDNMKVITAFLGRWLECVNVVVYVQQRYHLESLILLLLDRFGQMLQPSWWRWREVTGRFSAILHEILQEIWWTKFWRLGSEFPRHVGAQILFSNLSSDWNK